MLRLTRVLRQCSTAIEDTKLFEVLQSEIQYELTSNPTKTVKSGNFGEFKVDWDALKSQDVVLRRKFESGEEIAVSALLIQSFGKDVLDCSFEYFMKVCVTKPGLRSALQFDCGVSERENSGTWFDIKNVHYLSSTSVSPKPSAYLGPKFSTLDPRLQEALKKYLIALGISKGLTDFLLSHLRNKEQDQYVKWLQRMKSLVEQGDQQTN